MSRGLISIPDTGFRPRPNPKWTPGKSRRLRQRQPNSAACRRMVSATTALSFGGAIRDSSDDPIPRSNLPHIGLAALGPPGLRGREEALQRLARTLSGLRFDRWQL